VTGDTDIPVSADLANLSQTATYYYRVRAVNGGGVATGAIESLKLDLLSGLTQVFPGVPPDDQGYVFVTLNPSGIASGWRFVGEQQWRPSNFAAGALTTGDRWIEFRPVPSYIRPPNESVSVISGGAATLLQRDYYLSGASANAGLTVTLKPESLANPALPVADRAQWRFHGEDDTQWRDSGTTATALEPGTHVIECKPLPGRATPPLASVSLEANITTTRTITYFLAEPTSGTAASVIPFETVAGSPDLPYAFVGQIRSSVGTSSGFVVKPRVVATAGHVVFDDGTLAAVTGLQWLFQRDRASHDPTPLEPRGYYLFTGYSERRQSEGTPGTSSPASQELDVAALYFAEDAGRGGFSGFLASDAANNEFLLSSANKTLVGYPVDGISAANQGRMHATPPVDVTFTHGGSAHTYLTSAIHSSGGMSGGPLCVRFEGGNYYPAAVYLGGSGQTVVRSIDSQVIDLFNRAEVSGNGGDNQTGGGITHSSFDTIGNSSDPGALEVTIQPAAARNAGAGWRLKPVTDWQPSGNRVGDLNAGSYVLQLSTVSGFQTPTQQTVSINAGQLSEIIFTYVEDNTAPTIGTVADQTIDEDESTGALAFTIDDTETSESSLTVTASCSNTTLVPNANIVFDGSGANRAVTVTPAPNQSGSATITLTVSDGSLDDTDTFTLDVNPVNDEPTISNVTNKSTTEDQPPGTINFIIGDVDNAENSLEITGFSSNTTLVPNANIVFGGSGANRTVTITPAPNQSGTASIYLTVSDGDFTDTDTFVLTVTAVNGAPTISNIGNQTINEDSDTGPLSVTIGDIETPASSLTLNGSSSNTALVPNSNILFGGSGANRTVTVTPAPDQLGSATISVTVSDGTLTDTDTFTLTVTGTALQTWRFEHFGSTSNSGDGANSADPDGDGSSNLDEYTAGTGPNNPADVFKILTITKAASSFTVTANGKAARSYVLERQTTLGTGPWTPVDSVGPLAVDGPVNLSDSSPPPGSGFYQLQVSSP
jgi:hypothetical protein